MALTDIEVRYLTSQHHARLATVAPDGTPQNKPVGFEYNAAQGTIDIAGINLGASAKFRNVLTNPAVALVVDDVLVDDPAGPQSPADVRFMEIRGTAETLTDHPAAEDHLSPEIIRIHPRRVVSWNIDADHPDFQTRNLEAASEPG